MTEAHSAALHAGRHAVFAGLNFLWIKKSDGVACEIVLALHPWRLEGARVDFKCNRRQMKDVCKNVQLEDGVSFS